jgi:hypothetical protein
MPDEQVRIDVVADDHASKPIDAIAKKVDALESNDVDIPIGADTKAAERDVAGLLKKVDGLARDPATILLASNAAKIAADIADLIADLDRLDAEDPQVEVKSAQINDLSGDLDRVETKLRDINNIPVDIDTRKATSAIDDIGKSADSSKSVLANAVGNASQDLGELGGIAGTTGVAIGQIGEYASDALAGGEQLTSVLKNMGAVVGPLGALTLITIGLQGIKSNMDAVAETKAFNEDRVKSFAEALSDASITAAELAKALAVKDETGIFVRIENETVNVQKSIEATLGTFAAFQDAVAQGQQGFDRYAQSLLDGARAAGVNAIGLKNLRDGLDDARDGTLDNRLAYAGLDRQWTQGIETAAALGSAVSGVDTANRQATESARFWGQAVADSGGDAALAAQRTQDLKGKLTEYISTTQGVPQSIVTKIAADIDQGSLNRAEQELAILSRNRTMELSVIAKGGQAFGTNIGQNVPGPRALPPAPVEVINVTQHLPRGWRGNALAEARASARRSGGLYRRVRR